MNAKRNRKTRPRRAGLLLAVAMLGVLAAPAAAQGAFGLSEFDVTFTDGEGFSSHQAGSHPYEMTTKLRFNSEALGAGEVAVEETKDLLIAQVPGFVGDPYAVPRCSNSDFLTLGQNLAGGGQPDCPDTSAIGVALITVGNKDGVGDKLVSVFNLVAPPGRAAKIGFWVEGLPIPIELGTLTDPPYSVFGGPANISQLVDVLASELTLWGVPGDPAHDALRGRCVDNKTPGASLGLCEDRPPERPFLTLPRACEGPLMTRYEADSWTNPGEWVSGFAETHDSAGEPDGMHGCAKLGFAPSTAAEPSSRAASSPSGLEFSVGVENEGLANPGYEALADADIEKTVVTLPRGMTINPSQAEGLETCSQAQFDAESPFSAPGEGPTYTPPGAGCPEAAKIGTVEVETPILEDQLLKGAVYVATPYENPFNTLIALYMVIRDPERGLVFRIPLKVEPDPTTGQLVSTAEELPPYPFSRFTLHLREGGRSPLITPPGCGSFETKALLYPSSGAAPLTSTSSFEIVSGPNEGPCPSSTASFDPGFEAGTRNNAAGSYSPFDMRITRADGEQDITRFSSVLPPGVVARLAGTAWCPEAGIAQAKSRTGEHGGSAEKNDPSCPAESRIGTTIAGAGAGSQLTYVGGTLYLAGPYNGAPLSVVAITPALAGPFDAGAVVVREALTLNPVTGVAEVDGAASDPIPHILQGIPLNLRELQVRVDRPDFTINATSCAALQARATLWGGGTSLLPAAETPAGLGSRYQASSCASLGFKPRLAIRLYGGTRRGQFPALRAVVRPRAGQANFRRAVVTLPKTAFLEQGHIRTICTRVQFAAGAGHGAQCPKGAVYGHAKAWSPLLDAPASGPVYLRSSNHNLPDLVVALKGPDSAPVEVELSARIDSVRLGREGAGIRSTFAGIPDVPVSRFVLAMQGGRKGLIINSDNLCRRPARNRARANLSGQNGRRLGTRPVVRAVKCAKKRKAKRAGAGRGQAR